MGVGSCVQGGCAEGSRMRLTMFPVGEMTLACQISAKSRIGHFPSNHRVTKLETYETKRNITLGNRGLDPYTPGSETPSGAMASPTPPLSDSSQALPAGRERENTRERTQTSEYWHLLGTAITWRFNGCVHGPKTHLSRAGGRRHRAPDECTTAWCRRWPASGSGGQEGQGCLCPQQHRSLSTVLATVRCFADEWALFSAC